MSTRKILILDDEPAVAGLYALALENAGHEVIVCTGFEEARDYVKEELPGGLLTDVRVGEYNGLQLAILFRSLSPSAPLLVVSGHDDEVIKKEVEQIGATFLLKPFEMSTLARFFESESRDSSGSLQ